MSYGPSDGGKGSAPRPFSVTPEEFDNRWETIFGKKKKSEQEESPTKLEDGFDLESLDPAERSWYYDDHGIRRKKEEVKITATIPDIKIKGSI
jgi:hypothetical protein